jgi:hypothetical protein
MNFRTTFIHIAVCLLFGGLVAAFTPAKWVAASFWTSATLYFIGSLAYLEDALPGGFDNPDSSATHSHATGVGAKRFALQSLAVTLSLALIGFYIQFRSQF